MQSLAWLGASLVTLLVAGCASLDPELASSTIPGTRTSDPVVIALLDTGIYPYVSIYDIDADAEILHTIPLPATEIAFTRTGDARTDLDKDWPLYKSLDARVLYHVTGTRLFAIGFDDPSDREYPAIWDANYHGAATSYLAARDAPGAIIVMVQVSVEGCRGRTDCLVHPSLADGMEWIAAQDWIDVVSVSMGLQADSGELHEEAARYVAATHAAARSGKTIVNGAGNTPPPWMTDYFSGPPWIIRVGGAEGNASGMNVLASNGVDVVANFSDLAPRWAGEDLQWRSGTSFATPIVAGTLANALQIVREAAPGRVVTAEEIRNALNASATYFSPTDWDPRPPGRDPLPWDVVQYASLPVVAQPQMGWGYVQAGLAPEIARRILEQDFAIPAEKDQAMAFQPAWQQAREEFWARYS